MADTDGKMWITPDSDDEGILPVTPDSAAYELGGVFTFPAESKDHQDKIKQALKANRDIEAEYGVKFSYYLRVEKDKFGKETGNKTIEISSSGKASIDKKKGFSEKAMLAISNQLQVFRLEGHKITDFIASKNTVDSVVRQDLLQNMRSFLIKDDDDLFAKLGDIELLLKKEKDELGEGGELEERDKNLLERLKDIEYFMDRKSKTLTEDVVTTAFKNIQRIEDNASAVGDEQVPVTYHYIEGKDGKAYVAALAHGIQPDKEKCLEEMKVVEAQVHLLRIQHGIGNIVIDSRWNRRVIDPKRNWIQKLIDPDSRPKKEKERIDKFLHKKKFSVAAVTARKEAESARSKDGDPPIITYKLVGNIVVASICEEIKGNSQLEMKAIQAQIKAFRAANPNIVGFEISCDLKINPRNEKGQPSEDAKELLTVLAGDKKGLKVDGVSGFEGENSISWVIAGRFDGKKAGKSVENLLKLLPKGSESEVGTSYDGDDSDSVYSGFGNGGEGENWECVNGLDELDVVSKDSHAAVMYRDDLKRFSGSFAGKYTSQDVGDDEDASSIGKVTGNPMFQGGDGYPDDTSESGLSVSKTSFVDTLAARRQDDTEQFR